MRADIHVCASGAGKAIGGCSASKAVVSAGQTDVSARRSEPIGAVRAPIHTCPIVQVIKTCEIISAI